jgi:hypothetical protein
MNDTVISVQWIGKDVTGSGRQPVWGIRLDSRRSPYLFYLLTVGRRGCLFSLDHTRTHTTFGRTPLDEGSTRRRDLYLTTHNTVQETNIHAPGGIRTHNPSQRSAADLRLRRRGHWDRPNLLDRLSKTTTMLSQYWRSPGWKLNRRPPEYEAGMLLTGRRSLVGGWEKHRSRTETGQKEIEWDRKRTPLCYNLSPGDRPGLFPPEVFTGACREVKRRR